MLLRMKKGNQWLPHNLFSIKISINSVSEKSDCAVSMSTESSSLGCRDVKSLVFIQFWEFLIVQIGSQSERGLKITTIDVFAWIRVNVLGRRLCFDWRDLMQHLRQGSLRLPHQSYQSTTVPMLSLWTFSFCFYSCTSTPTIAHSGLAMWKSFHFCDLVCLRFT